MLEGVAIFLPEMVGHQCEA